MCLVDLRTEASHWIQVAMLGIAIHTSPALIVPLLCMIVLIMQYGHSCYVGQIAFTYVRMCMCTPCIVWQLPTVAAALMM